uniref:Uncharacterized protein n=1 Tax=Romanomermis culicivorax TaxID=13658 RepID=A0A915IAW6_ROMCU
MSDDFSAKEDLAKESDDLDIDVEEELAERFIDQPGKFTAKIIPRACFVTRDFFYFNAYCLAKELSNRSQAEFLYPILKNGQNDCDRSLKEMYLLCELPTGCYHFHPKHRFPDDACLDNYVSIVDLSVVNKRIDRLGLSKTLLGLAKISSVDDDLINKIGGFMRLTKWFAFAYGEKQTAFDAHLEARITSTCFRAAHIFLRQSSEKLPHFEIFAGLVSSKLEEFVLSELQHVNENQTSGKKCDEVIRKIIDAISDVECGFTKYSVLNKTVQIKVVDLAITSFEDYLLPGYCLANSMREKFIFCGSIRKLANVIQNWNVIHESFWRRFFEFYAANYVQLEKKLDPSLITKFLSPGNIEHQIHQDWGGLAISKRPIERGVEKEVYSISRARPWAQSS